MRRPTHEPAADRVESAHVPIAATQPNESPRGRRLTPLAPVQILADARRLGEGQGVRFRVVMDGIERDAFAVRYRGRVHAYLNTCRHQLLPLDFGDAHFFDETYDALVCCHHGARYRPETGECFGGPCIGARLTRLVVEERGGELWCTGVDQMLAPGSDPSS